MWARRVVSHPGDSPESRREVEEVGDLFCAVARSGRISSRPGVPRPRWGIDAALASGVARAGGFRMGSRGAAAPTPSGASSPKKGCTATRCAATLR